jgi:hypothetical protein
VDLLAIDTPTLERIDRLADAGRDRCLRSFAIWCVLQCQLNRSQAQLLRRCIRANDLGRDGRGEAMRAIRGDHAPRIAGAVLIGMKHDPITASVWIATVAVTDPSPREAAIAAAGYARLHASLRIDSLDRIQACCADPLHSGPASLAHARLWAATRAAGDQCDHLDRIMAQGRVP